MRSEVVEFFSEGILVRANWRTPDDQGPWPAIVQGPGWMGLKDAKDYDRYHLGLTEAGFAVLCIDYRGFGDSDGERNRFDAQGQVLDLFNAVSYLTTREDVEHEAIGAFATGGSGGANVVLLAAMDERVRAVVSQFPVADGADWLRRMRTEHEWHDYLAALEEDRRERVRTGTSRMIHPREEVMVQTPERKASDFKADVDVRISMGIPMSDVDAILRARPVDAARGLLTPVMLVGVERDSTTPLHHAEMIYDVLAGPKRLVVQRHTSHYAAYKKYADRVIPLMVDWFRTHLHGPGDVVVKNGN